MDKKKIVHQLDTPYSTAKWPVIGSHDQDTILELLCTLLAPIGEYRTQHIHKSKGKRDKKRKRQQEKDDQDSTSLPSSSPTPPELVLHVDVGLVAVTRHLQDLAARSRTSISEEKQNDGEGPSADQEQNSKKPRRPYSAVFIARSGQASILNSHLPQMIAVASQACTGREEEPIRLVGISKACEDRLSEALGVPRVSCIALQADAPNAASLVGFVREHVPVISLDWLDAAQKGNFQPTKINHVATTIGAKKQAVKS